MPTPRASRKGGRSFDLKVSPTSRNAVVIFTKLPTVGRVKTRMLDLLTEQQACRLQSACLADAVALIDALTLSKSAPVSETWLYVAGSRADALELGKTLRLSKQWRVEAQRGADLGARMRHAFTDLFRSACAKVVIIGTDTTWMGPRRLALAFRALDRADVVLGPASDGGYYLVGARRRFPGKILMEMFCAGDWGSSSVLRRTVAKLRSRRVPFRLLPRDFDLDRPEDLARAAKILRHNPHRSPALAKWIVKM